MTTTTPTTPTTAAVLEAVRQASAGNRRAGHGVGATLAEVAQQLDGAFRQDAVLPVLEALQADRKAAVRMSHGCPLFYVLGTI